MSVHPRVLHSGFQPIGTPTNSGLTLDTMFGAWPRGRLLEIVLRPNGSEPLRENVVLAPMRIAPADAIARHAFGNKVPSGAVDGLNNAVSRRGRTMPLKDRLRVTATVVNDLGPVVIPPKILRATADFHPSALHSLLGGVRAMKIALTLSRKLDVPIVPHFMDDWPAHLFQDGQLGGYARREAGRLLHLVLERSPLLLTIGEDMAAEYSERYGRPAIVIGNSVPHTVSGPAPAGGCGTRRLVYVGGLHLDREKVLADVARALEAGGKDLPAALDLYVPAADAPLAEALAAQFRFVHHRGSVAPEQVPGVLSAATATLFLESTDPALARFTRLSVSTKVPQYLAAGRPVLVVGPKDQGSVRALLASGSAVYAGSGKDVDEVVRAVDAVLSLADRESRWSLPSVFRMDDTRERLRMAVTEAERIWDFAGRGK